MRTLRLVAAAIFAVSTCLNFWNAGTSFGGLPPRETNDQVVSEKLFLQIRNALWRENYNNGDIAYASVRSFSGQPPNERDNLHWYNLRYVVIPLSLVQDIKTAPYVIGDFTGGDEVLEAPEGLVKISDPGEGLVLYKRKPVQ